MFLLLKRFSQCRSGATAIEYGLIATIMGAAVIAALPVLKAELGNVFTMIADGMTQ